MSRTVRTRHVGAPNTLEYRVYHEDQDGNPLSVWHDIPLRASENTYNMVVEIPRWSQAKMEITKEDFLNPIKQDKSKGKPRYIKNVYPYRGYIWNYGALPQTWDDPTHRYEQTGEPGDKDPLDVCEIGEKIGHVGQIKQVKILGVLGLVDQGETDWKIIAIDVTDPLADKMNGLEDVRRLMPGLLDSTVHIFRNYKIPDGKPANRFAFNGDFKDVDYAKGLVDETHESWKKLISGQAPNKSTEADYDIATANVSVEGSPYKIGPGNAEYDAVPKHAPLPPAPIEGAENNKWYYVDDKNAVVVNV